MDRTSAVSNLDKVGFKDWLLALIGLLFTLVSLFIITKDFKSGITTLALFGSCFALAVHVILRKLRLQKQLPLTASVVGGEPIRPSSTRIAMLGLGLLGVGTILACFQPDNNKLVLGCALLIAITGGLLLGGLATGILSRRYIQFDPPGITFGYLGGKAIIPWSAITQLGRGEVQSNQAVFMGVAQEAVMAEPASYLAKVHKHMASTRTWMGADFVIMSSTYGIDAPVLLAAMEKYIVDPQARAELQALPKLGN